MIAMRSVLTLTEDSPSDDKASSNGNVAVTALSCFETTLMAIVTVDVKKCRGQDGIRLINVVMISNPRLYARLFRTYMYQRDVSACGSARLSRAP